MKILGRILSMPCLNGFFFLFIFAVSNSRTLSNTLPRKKSSETYSESPVLDDWEQKLLGKKSVLPYSVSIFLLIFFTYVVRYPKTQNPRGEKSDFVIPNPTRP